MISPGYCSSSKCIKQPKFVNCITLYLKQFSKNIHPTFGPTIQYVMFNTEHPSW